MPHYSPPCGFMGALGGGEGRGWRDPQLMPWEQLTMGPMAPSPGHLGSEPPALLLLAARGGGAYLLPSSGLCVHRRVPEVTPQAVPLGVALGMSEGLGRSSECPSGRPGLRSWGRGSWPVCTAPWGPGPERGPAVWPRPSCTTVMPFPSSSDSCPALAQARGWGQPGGLRQSEKLMGTQRATELGGG